VPDFFKQVGAARFGVMAGVAAALTAFFLYIAGVVTEPPKTILFSGLESRDAAAVTAKLDGIIPGKYVVKGDTILVPADQVGDLRMKLAQDNLPAAGVGYEIFDKSDAFGTTAFVQNINQLRALEGELARSIQTIEGIQSARIHLVIPERQVFTREEQNPSASVVLKTRIKLDRGQVGAIQHLVAAAVPSLSPQRVAIIDDAGNLLAGGDGGTGGAATSADQDQQTSDYEERVRGRIESLVASVVGAGHVRAQVTADMTFEHTNVTKEEYNPDSKVVRSNQTVERNASDANGSGAAAVSVANALPGGQAGGAGGDANKSTSGSTEETTNYEINKTITTSNNDSGTLKRLSVAVVVDGEGAKARSAADMTQIEALVKSAMGFDPARGDQLQVKNMAFARLDAGDSTPAEKPLLGLDSAYWFKIIEAAILCVTALLIGLFVMRPLINRMFAAQGGSGAFGGAIPLLANGSPVTGALPAPSGIHAALANTQAALAGGQTAHYAGAPALGAPGMPGGHGLPPGATSQQIQQAERLVAVAKTGGIDLSQIEGGFGENSVKKVGEVVSAHPEEALSIIRTWLHQPV
jgi:flagellar M-ring protein FliF